MFNLADTFLLFMVNQKGGALRFERGALFCLAALALWAAAGFLGRYGESLGRIALRFEVICAALCGWMVFFVIGLPPGSKANGRSDPFTFRCRRKSIVESLHSRGHDRKCPQTVQGPPLLPRAFDIHSLSRPYHGFGRQPRVAHICCKFLK